MSEKPNRSVDAVAVRLGARGDVVLTTGVLDYWGRTRDMRFCVVTRARFAPVFEGHPAVAEVVALDEAKVRSEWFSICSRLAKSRGGLPLVDLHANGRTLLLASLWKGRYRKYPKLSLMRRLYRAFRPGFAAARLLRCNVPQRYALALEKEPPPAEELVPVIRVSEEETRKALEFLRTEDMASPFVALHPYATHVNKAWPKERWLELIELLERAGRDYLVLGMSKDPFLRGHAGKRDLTNATSLRATCALLAQASALVTGDSGPMHLATAVGTPVTALFGPTTRHWGFYPSGPGDAVVERPLPCRPCDLHGGAACARGHECLASITADEVFGLLPA